MKTLFWNNTKKKIPHSFSENNINGTTKQRVVPVLIWPNVKETQNLKIVSIFLPVR